MTEHAHRYLLTTWDGGGNVPPELGVARRLLRRGHHVHVLADPTVASTFEAVGCTTSTWRRAPHRTSLDPAEDLLKDWESSNPLVMVRRARDRFIAGPSAEFAADTTDAIEAFRPDCVVPDAFLFGSIIAAQGASVPVVPLVPNIWMLPSKGSPSFGPGFPPARTALGRARDSAILAVTNRVLRSGVPALNATRAHYGLGPIGSFYDQALGVDRILVLSSETFDYASPFVPPNARYVGPVLDDPSWVEPWTSPWPGSRDPFVLVGLSSTYQRQEVLLQRIVEALAALPVKAVVTLGQMVDPDRIVGAGNVAVVRSAPHRQLLDQASLVVSHCGHGTTLRALTAGVPMVCIPMGRDQNDTAARVVHLGAGVRLSPKSSAERIRRAVADVLAHPQYRASAERVSTILAGEYPDDEAVRELERVIVHRVPH